MSEKSLLKNLEIYFRKQIFRYLICVCQKTIDMSSIPWNVPSVVLVRSDWNMCLLLMNASYFRKNIVDSVYIVLFYVLLFYICMISSYGYNNNIIYILINIKLWLCCMLSISASPYWCIALSEPVKDITPLLCEKIDICIWNEILSYITKDHRGKWEEGLMTASSLGIMQCVENNKNLWNLLSGQCLRKSFL